METERVNAPVPGLGTSEYLTYKEWKPSSSSSSSSEESGEYLTYKEWKQNRLKQ